MPGTHAAVPQATQSTHPWRATVRTVVAALIALAAMAPLVYSAVTHEDPGTATGAAAGALAIAGAVTRVLAVPAVDAWLTRFVPWLAAAARQGSEVAGPAGEDPAAGDEPSTGA